MRLKSKYHLVIPASGIGSRFGGEIPKQYTKMANGLTILDNTIEKFINNGNFTKIIIALNKNDTYFQNSKFYKHPQITTIIGGEQRFNSVQNAVDFLLQTIDKDDFIAIHDSVRPCVANADINQLLIKIDADIVGGLLVSPVVDTLKQSGKILKTIDRSDKYLAQTPQIYRAHLLQKALKKVVAQNLSITDDASSMEILGLNSQIVIGSRYNIKITTQDDLKIANCILF